MTIRMLCKAAAGWGCLLLTMGAMLAFASNALAVQTDQYDAFSRCPTELPALNDPATGEFIICTTIDAPGATLKIGERQLPVSDFNVQFAVTGLGVEEPECPVAGACFGYIPGTTSLEATPSVINAGFRDRGPGPRGKARLEVTIESAGEVRAVTPAFLFEQPIPVAKVPIKLHVEAPWLGPDCYVGSDEEPIVLGPFAIGPPGGGGFASDPNGYKVEMLRIEDTPFADKAVALPGAHDCGHSRGQRYSKDHGRSKGDGDSWKNEVVEGLLGLPSAAGQNEMLLPDTLVALVAAPIDGTAPDGGAELQAAFVAAKQ